MLCEEEVYCASGLERTEFEVSDNLFLLESGLKRTSTACAMQRTWGGQLVQVV